MESDSGDLTFKVSSVLTLEVSRNDDNSFITCAVDHATLTSGNKKSAQALRVLCESNGGGHERMLLQQMESGGNGKLCVVYIFSLVTLFFVVQCNFFPLTFNLCLSDFRFATCK